MFIATFVKSKTREVVKTLEVNGTVKAERNALSCEAAVLAETHACNILVMVDGKAIIEGCW